MELKNKRVLVTGAGGFIGSHLVERLLNEGCKARALVHYNSGGKWGNLEFLPKKILNEIEIFMGDIRDPYATLQVVNSCDIVFHLASLIAIPYSYVAPQSYVETNILGTLNILEACRKYDIEKIIHTSTSETYGTALYTPIDEAHPLQGQSPYSASKIGADKIAESYFLSFGVPVATLRPFNTFGPRQSARAIIPTVISQILSGKEKIILGSLDPVRDFTYVEDTVDGFIKIATCVESNGKIINLGCGQGVTIGKLVNIIQDIMESKAEIVSSEARTRPDKSEVMQLICNNQEAKKIIKWEPRYSLKEGLRETIDFVKENLKLYKAEIYNI